MNGGGVPGPAAEIDPPDGFSSCVAEATDMTQGPMWLTLPTGSGVSARVLPAEADTKMPALTNSRKLRAPSPDDHGEVPPEIE